MSEAKTPDKDDIIRMLMRENDLLRREADITKKICEAELMQAAAMLLVPAAWSDLQVHRFISRHFIDFDERPTPPAPQE